LSLINRGQVKAGVRVSDLCSLFRLPLFGALVVFEMK